MRFLQGLGPDRRGVGDIDVFPAVGERLVLGPGLDQHVHRFHGPLPGLVQRDAETGHFVGLVAPAHTADEPAVNQVVQYRHLFRQAQRVPDGQHQDAGGDFHPLGALADVQRLEQRRRGVAVVGKVVFGNQAVIESDFLGVLDLLDAFFKEGLPVSNGGIGPFAKKSKVHARGVAPVGMAGA